MIILRDETFRFVVNLRTSIKDGEEIGTGMFVVKGKTKPYLVTASHVARSCNAKTSVVLSNDKGNAVTLKLSDFDRNLTWRHHPVADLAALPIKMSARLAYHMNDRCLPFDHFHTGRTPPSRDLSLTSVGFPHGLGTVGPFSPLSYRSYASSAFVTLPRGDTQTLQTFFLLENQSVSGYSGCPVFDLGYSVVGGEFTAISDKTKVYGLMHGALPDVTGGNLSSVTPAFYLTDLL